MIWLALLIVAILDVMTMEIASFVMMGFMIELMIANTNVMESVQICVMMMEAAHLLLMLKLIH